jgi:uncharacterized protein YbjT (DUF2867 family)
MVILIIGGNGAVGSEVVKILLKQNIKIRILSGRQEKWTETPAGVEQHYGDLNVPETIVSALRGINRVFLLITHGPQEVQQGINVIRLCRQAKVDKIVYLSIFRTAAAISLPHFQSKMILEQEIIATGLNYTFVRPCLFFQNDFWYQEAINTYGIYPQPIGNKGVSRVDIRDVAEVAVKVLLKNEYNRDAISLAGPEVLSAAATIEILTEQLGHEIKYLGDDLESWSVQAKLIRPAWKVESWVQTYRMVQLKGLIAAESDLAKLTEALGRSPRNYRNFIADHPQYFSCNFINQ